MARDISVVPGSSPRLAFGRRMELALTARLHSLLAGIAWLTLGGLPRVDGLPVLRGRGTTPAARERLETALDLLTREAPGRRQRLGSHVLGLFLIHSPRAHGHYSRITGTCTLDPDLLLRESPVETAALLVRCATEAWLWTAGRGRLPEDEERLLEVSNRARLHFIRRMQAHKED